MSVVPAAVLGGSGYVAGELLRLLAAHPRLRAAAVYSDSQPGAAVAEVFPHLGGAYGGLRFAPYQELDRLGELSDGGPLAIFSAAPHGTSAGLADRALAAAERARIEARCVDLSADFRFSTAEAYARVYGHAHGAPARLGEFTCAVPEHFRGIPARHAAHPGCFPTAVLLAAVPLVAQGWIEPRIHVTGITGSTGAGRSPRPTTHHPERRSNVFAYSPLAHRHEPEMRALLQAATGVATAVHFVPQSGPFARGIHATLHARLARPATAEELRTALAEFYAGAPFVEVVGEPPRVQDVAGTNRCRLAVAVADGALVALSALDNLTKGAAGGGVQWMNRLLGFAETEGLNLPGLGWI